jgi:hypothetical protein
MYLLAANPCAILGCKMIGEVPDSVSTALRHAPVDDEPVTEEEKAAVAEAHDWLQKNGGKGIPHGEAMRELGLD